MRLAILAFLLAATASAADYYASPAGGGSTCSLAAPCSLATGLTKPASSDTLWLRGGTYQGSFTSNLVGATVRAYQAEIPIIDLFPNNPGRNAALTINGSGSTYRGIHFTDSDTNRPVAFIRPDCVVVFGPNTSLINNYMHNGGQGIANWNPAPNSITYGNIVTFNGGIDLEHGMYYQNNTPGTTKLIKDNVMAHNAGHGIQYYAGGGPVGGQMVGNVVFNNGGSYIGVGIPGNRNILIGGRDSVMDSNMTYYPDDNVWSAVLIGLYDACVNSASVVNNYFASPFELDNCAMASITGNTFYGHTIPTNFKTLWPSNTFTARPGATPDKIFVRPNTYEPGRCNVAVYNWSHAASVAVNLASCGLAEGQSFGVRYALNFEGANVVSGAFHVAAPTVTVPMTGLVAEIPVGYGPIPQSLPEFGAFIVLPTGGVSSTPTPTATVTPAITPSPTFTYTRTATSSATPTQTRTFVPSLTPTRPPTATPTIVATMPAPTVTPAPPATPPFVCVTATPTPQPVASRTP